MPASERDPAKSSEEQLGRKADVQGLVKASEQFSIAMENKGMSQATLMVTS